MFLSYFRFKVVFKEMVIFSLFFKKNYWKKKHKSTSKETLYFKIKYISLKENEKMN